MVQQSRQRIASRRVHELLRLPTDARLRGPEDKVEEEGGDQRATQRHDDDVATDALHRREDRRCVPPDADDCTDAAVCGNRQVFTDERRGRERRASFARRALEEHGRRDRASHCDVEVGCGWLPGANEAHAFTGHDRPIR